LADWSGNQEGQVIVQLAAEQGFVALAPTYDSSSTNNDAGKNGHAACMFGPSHPNNVVSYACSLAEADCSNGVLVAGFSQGGSIALRAKNYDPQVTAAWVMGANGLPIDTQNEAAPAGTRALPDNKLRIDLGELDVTPGGTGAPNVTGLAALTGDNCGGIYDCLQSDGSGYYIVSNAEVADHSADHCYWMAVSKIWYGCTLHPTIAGLDPGFAPPSTLTWSMITNLNWLAGQL
jgi:pimeloyl-ACP methyl ester carboxylesterase